MIRKTREAVILNEEIDYKPFRLKPKGKILAKKVASKGLIYAVLITFSLWVIAPFLVILSTSLKHWQEANSLNFTLFPKDGVDLSGYKYVFEYKSSNLEVFPTLVRGFLNTLLYIVPPTVVGLFVSALSAYAFAKIRFRSKKLLFSILIGTMFIPGIIMLVPSYVIYDKLGLIDTPFPLMVPGMFGAAACVFFMRQFFKAVPDELVEAAKLDGMGHMKIFFRLMIPLSVPALLAQGILGFVAGYNDYLMPLLFLQSPELYTLQIALFSFAGTAQNYVNVVMAGSIMVLLPVLVIYTFAQKYFIEGIVNTGMKS
jgi:ABC-type sugar transport system, permease component